jgi:hypothetical protein
MLVVALKAWVTETNETLPRRKRAIGQRRSSSPKPDIPNGD